MAFVARRVVRGRECSARLKSHASQLVLCRRLSVDALQRPPSGGHLLRFYSVGLKGRRYKDPFHMSYRMDDHEADYDYTQTDLENLWRQKLKSKKSINSNSASVSSKPEARRLMTSQSARTTTRNSRERKSSRKNSCGDHLNSFWSGSQKNPYSLASICR